MNMIPIPTQKPEPAPRSVKTRLTNAFVSSLGGGLVGAATGGLLNTYAYDKVFGPAPPEEMGYMLWSIVIGSFGGYMLFSGE